MKRNAKFSFLVHPLNLESMSFILGGKASLLKFFGEYNAKKFIKYLPSYKYVRLLDVASVNCDKVDGLIVICPLLPEHFVTLNHSIVVNKILHCVKIAERFGASIVGLGGFTSIFTNQGLDIIGKVKPAVTTGNSLTASMVIEGICKAIEVLKKNSSKLHMSIIGATGDIGSICSRVFKKKVQKLTLIARDERRLSSFAELLERDGGATVESSVIFDEKAYSSDVILAATSATSSLLDYKKIRPGAIVCDVSIPPNISREAIKMRNDILVFEGGYVSIPYYNEIKEEKFLRHFKHKSIYGCLAETIVLALESKFENFSIGRGQITMDKILAINQMAKKHGYNLSPFFCGEREYTNEDFVRIGSLA